jgi:hypothetical protein
VQSTFQSMSGPGPCRMRGWQVLSWAHCLTLSQCTDLATPFRADFQNCIALLHTCQIPGEKNLHLVTARSKLNGIRHLTDFPDLGSFWVKSSPTLPHCTLIVDCPQRPYSQSQSRQSVIRNFIKEDIFTMIFTSSRTNDHGK